MFVVALFCVLVCCVLCGCCISAANKHVNEEIKGADEANSRFRQVDQTAVVTEDIKKEVKAPGRGGKAKDGFNQFESELTNLDDIEKADPASVPIVFSKDGSLETTCL